MTNGQFLTLVFVVTIVWCLSAIHGKLIDIHIELEKAGRLRR